MIVPWGYGYCNIQLPDTQTNKRTFLNTNFKVGSESKVNYKPIKIEAESKGHYIHRKVIGYRPNLDLYLYDYGLSNETYGANLVKDYGFRNIVNGTDLTNNSNNIDWFSWNTGATDIIEKTDYSDKENGILFQCLDNSYMYIYQNLIMPPREGNRFAVKVKYSASSSADLRVTLKVRYFDNNDSANTYYLISETNSVNTGENVFEWVSYSGSIPTLDYPNKIDYFQVMVGTSQGDTLLVSDIKVERQGNQNELIEFLYNYYNNTNEDNHILIYPYAGGSNFWSFNERMKQKFYNFLIDEMELSKNNGNKPELGNSLHIVGKNADIISKSELNYVIYRDTENGQWSHIPLNSYSPDAQKGKALLPYRNIVR